MSEHDDFVLNMTYRMPPPKPVISAEERRRLREGFIQLYEQLVSSPSPIPLHLSTVTKRVRNAAKGST